MVCIYTSESSFKEILKKGPNFILWSLKWRKKIERSEFSSEEDFILAVIPT